MRFFFSWIKGDFFFFKFLFVFFFYSLFVERQSYCYLKKLSKSNKFYIGSLIIPDFFLIYFRLLRKRNYQFIWNGFSPSYKFIKQNLETKVCFLISSLFFFSFGKVFHDLLKPSCVFFNRSAFFFFPLFSGKKLKGLFGFFF